MVLRQLVGRRLQPIVGGIFHWDSEYVIAVYGRASNRMARARPRLSAISMVARSRVVIRAWIAERRKITAAIAGISGSA